MKGLLRYMTHGGSSYGEVPGNGSPKADDKRMNAGPGHVVPAENAHIAKKIVEELGYEPDKKVSLNQGGGEGKDIKISSKEYFLNDDQVDEMQTELGIDPETLSPNSPYNERVHGGTTKQVKNMVNKKLSLAELMSNNNNQYPGYIHGGGTDDPPPSGWPREFQSALHQSVYGDNVTDETRAWAANAAEKEWPNYMAGKSQYQYIDLPDEVKSQWGIGTPTLETKPVQQIQNSNIPSLEDRVPLDSNGNPINIPGITTGEENQPQASGQRGTTIFESDQSPEKATDINANQDPYDKAQSDMLQRSEDLTQGEKATQVGMGLWNLSRSYQPLPEPALISGTKIRRDYEAVKNEMTDDAARVEARNRKAMKELGVDPLKAGLAAGTNTLENTRKINKTILDMAYQDTTYNANVENQDKRMYNQAKFQRDFADARGRADFAKEKGQKIADNAREYWDAEEAGLYRESGLRSEKANEEMRNLDNEYDSLDKSKMYGKDFISRESYHKMSQEERDQLKRKYSKGSILQ